MKAIFSLVQTYFETNLPTRMVETHFLSLGNHFLLFNLFFYKWKLSLKLAKTFFFFFLFLGGRLYSRQQKGIFCLVKTVFFYFVLLSCKSKQLLKLVDTSTFKSVFSIKWPFLMSKYKKQFCRVLKITVQELTWFTFSHLFGHTLHLKLL